MDFFLGWYGFKSLDFRVRIVFYFFLSFSFNYKKRIKIFYGVVKNKKVILKCLFGYIVGI